MRAAHARRCGGGGGGGATAPRGLTRESGHEDGARVGPRHGDARHAIDLSVCYMSLCVCSGGLGGGNKGCLSLGGSAALGARASNIGADSGRRLTAGQPQPTERKVEERRDAAWRRL